MKYIVEGISTLEHKRTQKKGGGEGGGETKCSQLRFWKLWKYQEIKYANTRRFID